MIMHEYGILIPLLLVKFSLKKKSLDRVVTDKTVEIKWRARETENTHTQTHWVVIATPLHKYSQFLDINLRILRITNVLLLFPQSRLFDRMSLVRKNSSTSAISSLFMGELSELPDLFPLTKPQFTKKTCNCTAVSLDKSEVMASGHGLGGASPTLCLISIPLCLTEASRTDVSRKNTALKI